MNEKGDKLTTLVYEFILYPATGSKLGLQVEPTLLRCSSEVSGPNPSCEKHLLYFNQPYLEKNLKACSSFELDHVYFNQTSSENAIAAKVIKSNSIHGINEVSSQLLSRLILIHSDKFKIILF
jgi:hypothetical protein